METDGPAEVDVLGHRATTFHVEGHHYALVLVEDLEPGTVTPYEVTIGGEVVWPPPDGRPPCAIHTREFERQSRLVFGSCRVGMPQQEPYTRSPSDASSRCRGSTRCGHTRGSFRTGSMPWPDAVLLLGDQVYADEVPPETAAFVRGRRDSSEPPGKEVADFEEFTRLYRESWSDPGHPLAALDGALHDDLRRPRREGRLEHLAGLGRRDALAALVGRAHHRRFHVVLALPAPRQSLAP